LVVDDEPLAREGIRSLASKDSCLTIIGDASNGKEAVEAIRKMRPDVIFLDIQMPEMNGFQVLTQLNSEKLPYVIFITAYDQYAVRAFEVHALDYLLKPVDEERFQRAVERAKSLLHSRTDWHLQIRSILDDFKQSTPRYLEWLIIKENGRVFLLKTDEIDWIEASGNYATVHSAGKSYLIREAMTSLESELDPTLFCRIHRSTIVHIDRIVEMEPLLHGDCRVKLKDGTVLLISRRFRDRLKPYF
jgi:two-component system LytT family response regulator